MLAAAFALAIHMVRTQGTKVQDCCMCATMSSPGDGAVSAAEQLQECQWAVTMYSFDCLLRVFVLQDAGEVPAGCKPGPDHQPAVAAAADAVRGPDKWPASTPPVQHTKEQWHAHQRTLCWRC